MSKGGAIPEFVVNERIAYLNAPPKEALGERAPIDENKWFVVEKLRYQYNRTYRQLHKVISSVREPFQSYLPLS